MRLLALSSLVLGLVGCGSGGSQPDFADLQPVKGVVKRNGQPMNGGQIVLTQDPDKQEFGVNSIVGADGSFTLTTYRMTDKSGERKQGAPAGNYKGVYIPNIADQSAGGTSEPIRIPTAIVVKAGANDLTIELPAKK